MTRAVENSFLIIIFVSKSYFNSPYCKKEADYCSQSSKQLVFVMLDENYLTNSSPEKVSGWLAFLVGSQLWYGLWDLDQLESTSSSMIKRIKYITSGLWDRRMIAVTNNESDKQAHHQHIMLSYAWFYKKDHVIALEEKLKQAGYDVWRDETGSSIVPPLGFEDTSFESIARAVENSSLIIIFVSKSYFRSANYKREAEYCCQSSKSALFVMLDENYHTHSSPEIVEGWLSHLVGTQIWIPLWDLAQLDSTFSYVALKNKPTASNIKC
jgi:hypothetical protein